MRFRKEVVTELCHLLYTELAANISARTSLSVAVKVTVALNFYATGSFQSPGGDICNISQFAVHCCIRQVTDTLYSRCKFNMSRQSQDERAHGFVRIAGFLMVQGAIDCTNVGLWAPPHNGEVFRNRKSNHSLNVQLVCDHRQMILIVNTRYSATMPSSCGRAVCQDCSSHRMKGVAGSSATKDMGLDFPLFLHAYHLLIVYFNAEMRLHNLAIMRGLPLPGGMDDPPQEDNDEEEDEELQPRRRQPDIVTAARAAR
uniref:putative nuclease HARBI1 n=1 Tax=Pristiophorus japonicus TaxID=55135 RepID=UPI00398F11BE